MAQFHFKNYTPSNIAFVFSQCDQSNSHWCDLVLSIWRFLHQHGVVRTDIRTETDKQTKRFANIDNKIGESVPCFSHRQILEVLCICLFVLYDEPGSGRCSDVVCELQRGSLSLLCRYIAVNELTVIMYYLTVQVRIQGGAPGARAPPDPRFWGPKIDHFWALFNFSIIFFCLASLGILFL